MGIQEVAIRNTDGNWLFLPMDNEDRYPGSSNSYLKLQTLENAKGNGFFRTCGLRVFHLKFSRKS